MWGSVLFMDPSSFGEVSSPTGSIHFVDLNIFRSSCGFVHFCGVDRVFGSVYFVDYLGFLPFRGLSILWTRNFNHLVTSRPLGVRPLCGLVIYFTLLRVRPL